MKEFALIFRLNKGHLSKPSAEQIAARKQWLESLAVNNHLSDRGHTLSLEVAGTIRPDKTVQNGAHAEVGEVVTGYVLVKAGGIEEAMELAKSNPIFRGGGSIEVREAISVI